MVIGQMLGPYQVIEKLGEGGMGEVYKARDTRLDRSVAIKILPAHVSADPERRARFEREAKTIAGLTHPHICTLYDVGEHPSTDSTGSPQASPGHTNLFLVMEHLQGETLAARLQKGPLPLEQALAVATEIADALSAAHRQGVIHRDLKPGNVMLTKAGAKLLDFGLARLRGHGEQPAAAQLAAAPTRSTPLTCEGTILGTLQYMAPEQLEGKPPDARTDIWALGATLYEMTAGRQAFGGETQASVIAAILGADPPTVSTLQPAAPPALDRLLKRCLAKDPDQRWQSAHDVMLALSESAAQPASHPPSAPLWRSLFWAVAALLLAAVATAIYFGRRPAVDQPAVELTLLAPEKTTFDSVAVSPDGRRFAFTATDTSGRTQLWARTLSSVAAQPLAGTDGAFGPFWSPDSRFIAFFADGRLKTIEASGGSLRTLANFSDSFGGALGGAWNRDGVILFPPTHAEAIYRSSATGGEAGPASVLEPSRQEHAHQWPQFLPDGRHFLYFASGGPPEHVGMRVGSLDPKEPARVLAVRGRASYAEGPDGTGYLLFIRDRTLLAQPFDARRLELSGEPIIVTEPVASFSVSENGVLVYDSSGRGGTTQLTWFDRKGKRLGVVGEPGGTMSCPSLSPDEKRAAIGDREGEVWVYELPSHTGLRLTFHGGHIPIWSPDGGRIVYFSSPDGIWRLYQKRSTGAGEEELLLGTASREVWPVGWSRDGRFLLYGETDPMTRWDLCVLANPLGPPAERKPFPFLRTEFDEDFGQFSPDGKWIAYHSDESGRYEIYVRPFRPDAAEAPGTGGIPPGGKWQVSHGGGLEPRWRADGKELFFYGLDYVINSVPVKTGDVFESGTPQPLFRAWAPGYLRYDVTSDGQRFLINTNIEEASSAVTVILNWTAALKR